MMCTTTYSISTPIVRVIMCIYVTYPGHGRKNTDMGCMDGRLKFGEIKVYMISERAKKNDQMFRCTYTSPLHALAVHGHVVSVLKHCGDIL